MKIKIAKLNCCIKCSASTSIIASVSWIAFGGRVDGIIVEEPKSTTEPKTTKKTIDSMVIKIWQMENDNISVVQSYLTNVTGRHGLMELVAALE